MSETPVSSANASLSTGNDTNVEYNNSTFIYCLLEAQNWVGVDTIAPDCVSDPNNTLCTDPDAANRLVGFFSPSVLIAFLLTITPKANLYNDTVVSLDCCEFSPGRSHHLSYAAPVS